MFGRGLFSATLLNFASRKDDIYITATQVDVEMYFLSQECAILAGFQKKAYHFCMQIS